jgi:cytidine deaminase
MKIFMYGRKPGKNFESSEEEAKEEFVMMTIGELLPMSFGRNDMDKREVK